MISDYSDEELVEEMRRRLDLYKKIGELNFYFSNIDDILAVRIDYDGHSLANRGDYWVLNGNYALTPIGNNKYVTGYDDGAPEEIIWSIIKGKDIKKVLGDEYFEYVNEGFLESMEAD